MHIQVLIRRLLFALKEISGSFYFNPIILLVHTWGSKPLSLFLYQIKKEDLKRRRDVCAHVVLPKREHRYEVRTILNREFDEPEAVT